MTKEFILGVIICIICIVFVAAAIYYRSGIFSP